MLKDRTSYLMPWLEARVGYNKPKVSNWVHFVDFDSPLSTVHVLKYAFAQLTTSVIPWIDMPVSSCHVRTKVRYMPGAYSL